MRLLAGFLFVALTGSLAAAETVPPAPPAAAPAPAAARSKIPLRVVRVMTAEHQALLFDRDLNKSVLAEVGGTVHGFTVDDIADDEVTLSRNGAEIVLAAPDQRWRERVAARRAPDGGDGAGGAGGSVRVAEAPGGAAAGASTAAPIDPYAGESAAASAPVRVVEAPAAPADGASEIRTVEAPGADPAAGPSPTATADAGAPPSAPAIAPSAPPTGAANVPVASGGPVGVPVSDLDSPPEAGPTPAPTAAVPSTAAAVPSTAAAVPSTAAAVPSTAAAAAIQLPRHDVLVAMSNFSKIAASIRGSFSPAGAQIATVAPSSLFSTVGLRAGDLVTAVDGQPLGSIDDAAELYVRVSTARNVTIDLVRGGKPLTLRVSIQ